MQEAVDSLFEMLIEDVPVGFVSSLIERTPTVYQEAFSRSYDEPSWDETEGLYILGHSRRVIFEPMFRNEAIKAGLSVDVKSNGRNCPYTLVRAGRFIITASHVRNKSELTKKALFRQQHAVINHLLMNPMLPFLEFDPLRLSDADNIYAIILHGEEPKNPQHVGFMRVAFPSAEEDAKSYVENICLFELHQEMLLRARAIPQTEIVVDVARPRIKKQELNKQSRK